MKRTMLVVVAVAAIGALAAPGAALAKWTHGQATLQADNTINFTGQFKYQGQIGSAECQVVTHAQLTAGTTTGHTQFDVDNEGLVKDEDKCSIGGGTISLGCTDVEQMTVSGSFTLHGIATTTIEITTGTIQYHLTGGIFCPKTKQLTPGSFHVTTNEHLFEQGQSSGTLKLHSPSGEQQATVSGEVSVTSSGTYGVA